MFAAGDGADGEVVVSAMSSELREQEPNIRTHAERTAKTRFLMGTLAVGIFHDFTPADRARRSAHSLKPLELVHELALSRDGPSSPPTGS
jgi:hypothetical protein